jgi:hypothetical protein
METEIPTELRAAITELLDLTLRNAHRKPKVFVIWSGHVQQLEVRAYRNGWSRNCGPDFDIGFYVDHDRGEALRETRKAIEYVRNLYSNETADES